MLYTGIIVGQSERRHDIDLLRVLSFGTLIIYHTSLLYGTKTWLLNSQESSRLMDLVAVGSHLWRMSLLFFISGLSFAFNSKTDGVPKEGASAGIVMSRHAPHSTERRKSAVSGF